MSHQLNPGRRVWMITQYFPPEITAAAFRLGGLAEYLRDEGFDVTVFAATPRSTSGQGDGPPAGVRVIRVPVSTRSHAGQYLQFLAGIALHSRRERRLRPPRMVLASSPPLSVFPAAMYLARRTGARLILDVRDLWPETPAALGRLPRRGWVFRWLRQLEHRAYLRADAVCCVSRPMAELITAETGVPVTVAYNGVDRHDLAAAASLPPPRRPRPGTPVDVVYFGNLGLAQGLDVLLEAGRSLDPGAFQFHLMGGGVRRREIARRIREAGLEHFHLYPPRPRGELLMDVARRAQILFVNLHPHAVFARTIPSKLFDCLLLRRPVVTGIRGEGREILQRAGCAVCFAAERGASLAAALEDAARRWENLTSRARRGNLKVLEEFRREDQYAKVAELVRRVDSSKDKKRVPPGGGN